MITHHCFGIIPLRKRRSKWEILLVEHKKGFWGFPKGHASDSNESPEQIAIREMKEETGLTVVRLLQVHPLIEQYYFKEDGKHFNKFVTYFLAEVKGRMRICEQEIISCQWLSLDRALSFITFEESRRLCIEAKKLLRANRPRGK